MPKCDFNKVAKQLYWNHTSAWVFSCNFGACFQNTFLKNTSGGLLLNRCLVYLGSWCHYCLSNYFELKLCLWLFLLPKFCNNSSSWHGLRKVTWCYDDDIIYFKSVQSEPIYDLLAKLVSYGSYGNGDINSYINSNMNPSNDGHKILRRFDAWPNFPFTKRSVIISNKHDIYELPTDLRLQGNPKTS